MLTKREEDIKDNKDDCWKNDRSIHAKKRVLSKIRTSQINGTKGSSRKNKTRLCSNLGHALWKTLLLFFHI